MGTLLNTATVVVGALLGKAIGDRLPPRLRETAIDAIGLMTLALGMQMALGSRNGVIVLGALLLGGLTGEALRIEDRLNALGDWVERRVSGDGETEVSPARPVGDFSRGFVTTSILFCVGPITLLGCLNDGLRGDIRLLAIKSTLDGFSALAFASALGWGVLCSAGTVLVLQSLLTYSAGVLNAWLTEPMRAELFATGGVMMLGLGLRLLDLKPIRVANFLPGLLYAPLLVALAHAIASRR
jgi:uncharacterized protein